MDVILRRIFSVLVVVGIAGCGGSAPEPTQPGVETTPGDAPQFTICLLPKIKGISYFTSCAKGAEEAAAELDNVTLIYDGPTDGDARKQAEMIEQWIIDGVDAICVAPSAPDVVAAAMKEAQAAGIHVLTWDADGTADSRSWFVNQATPESIGQGMVDVMIADVGGPDVEGEVVIISSDATADNQNSWIGVMKPALAKSKLELVTIKYPGENASNALGDAQDVLRKYPDLKGIFGISSVSFPGAAEAVEQQNRSGEVMVTGLSTPGDMREFVRNGTVKSVILWNTIDLGYLTIHAAEAMCTGQLKPDDRTFDAGRLGALQIAGDNILLGDIMVFNAENIDDYDF